MNKQLSFAMLVLLSSHIASSQTIREDILQKVVEKNERVLGLDDTTLATETNQIRVFNLSKVPFDPSLENSINPLNGFFCFGYRKKYVINLVASNKFEVDINTGRYRDLFIVGFDEANDTLNLSAVAFLFKPKDGVNQNKLLAEFQFVKRTTRYELVNFRQGAVD